MGLRYDRSIILPEDNRQGVHLVRFDEEGNCCSTGPFYLEYTLECAEPLLHLKLVDLRSNLPIECVRIEYECFCLRIPTRCLADQMISLQADCPIVQLSFVVLVPKTLRECYPVD